MINTEDYEKNPLNALRAALTARDAATMQDLLDLPMKLHPDDTDWLLEQAEAAGQNDMVTMLLDYKKRTYTAAELAEAEQVRAEKEFGLRERELRDWQRIFHIKETADGYIFTEYLAADQVIELPAAIEGRPLLMAEPGAFIGRNVKIYGSYARSGPDFKEEWGKISNARIGSTVLLGRYPTAADGSPAPLEWTILARDGRRTLLLAKKGIDALPYHEGRSTVFWETSRLRAWLNGPFLDLVFTDQERKLIRTAELENKYDLGISDSGHSTKDRVFLLSLDETHRYFKDNAARQCSPTPYAQAKGVRTFNGRCWWWLRSPSLYGNCAATVRDTGVAWYHGYGADFGSNAIRPAIWISPEEETT